MTLENQLSNKLNLIKEKVNKAKSACNFTFELVKNYLIKESLNADLNRLFALKKAYLEKVKLQINLLEIKYKTIKRYKDIISTEASSLHDTLNVMDEYSDELSNIISELQAISIILENRLKEE